MSIFPPKTDMEAKPRPNWCNPLHLLAFGLGSGGVPKAPGTAGTLAAIPFYLVLSSYSIAVYLVVLAIMLIFGVWLCSKVSEDLGVHDHGGIVWDEWVGFLITMICAPSGWLWVVIGFLLFRLFDIWKPWPIGYLDQHLSGGFGIMLDDVLAGVYSLLLLQILAHILA